MPKTEERNIPSVTLSWCNVPNAPLRLKGAISVKYNGAKQFPRPAKEMKSRWRNIPWLHLIFLNYSISFFPIRNNYERIQFCIILSYFTYHCWYQKVFFLPWASQVPLQLHMLSLWLLQRMQICGWTGWLSSYKVKQKGLIFLSLNYFWLLMTAH